MQMLVRGPPRFQMPHPSSCALVQPLRYAALLYVRPRHSRILQSTSADAIGGEESEEANLHSFLPSQLGHLFPFVPPYPVQRRVGQQTTPRATGARLDVGRRVLGLNDEGRIHAERLRQVARLHKGGYSVVYWRLVS